MKFNGPRGVAVDGSGNIYLVDSGNSVIRKMSQSGVVTTFAGSVSVFSAPFDVAVDSAGNVYVADFYADSIRKVTVEGLVLWFAGGDGGSSDGIGTMAQFNHPNGVAVDSEDNVYVAAQSSAYC